jgi:hypothetical protein
MGPPLVSLDRRIADALVEIEHDADDLQALLVEIERTIGSISAEVVHASQEMLSPQNADYIATKEHVDRGKLMLDRYGISLPKLQALHAQAVARDQLAAWHGDLDKLVVVRDEVSARFRERYCAIGAELVALFDEVVATDKQIEALHIRAPAGTPRMRKTEAVARGVERFEGATKSLLEEVKLPMFGVGSGAVTMAWPRPTVPWQIAYAQQVQQMTAGPAPDPAEIAEIEAAGGGWLGEIAVRNKRAAEESARVAAYYERREHGREANNIAEAQAEARRRNGA